MVSIFSKVKINGKNVSEILNDSDKKTISTEIQNYWKSLRLLKTRSEFGIAKNTFDVIRAIIKNDELIIPASIVLNGEYGEKDVCMGVPITIESNGLTKIHNWEMNKLEEESLKLSAQTIRNNIRSI